MTTVVASLTAQFGADTSGFKSGLGEVKSGMEGAAKNFSARLDGMSQGMTKFGRGLGITVAPAAAAFGAAAKSAIDFERTMTDAQAILGVTRDDMVGINAQVLALGRTSIAGPQAAAEAFIEIAGGVADASTHMAILEASMKTAEAGAAELAGTTSAMVSIMNAYGFTADETAMVSDVLTRTVGMGVLTMDELAAAIPNVTGLGKTMGVEFNELGGAMALITTKGFSASTAANQIQSAMVALIKPTGDMADAFDELGVASGDELIAKYGGLRGALVAVTDTEAYAEKGAGALFGRVEALNAVLTLTDENAEGFLDEFNAGVEGATDAARAVQLESFSAQFALLKSEVQGVAIEVGTALLPGLVKLARMIYPVVQAFGSFASRNRGLITVLAGITGGIVALSAAAMGVGTILGGLAPVLGVLLGPIGLVAAAVAGLALAVKTNFLGIGDQVKALAGAISGFIGEAKSAFEAGGLEGVGQLIVDKIKAGVGSVKEWAEETFGPFVDEVRTAFDTGGLPAVGGVILDKIAEGISGVVDWVDEHIASPIATEIGKIDWAGALSTAQDTLGDILDTLAAAAVDFGRWARTNVLYPVADAIRGLDWAGGLAVAGNVLGDILDLLAGGIVDFAQWARTNILYPVIDAIRGLDWAGGLAIAGNVLGDILDILAGAAVDFGQWARLNILYPVVGAVKDVDWGAAFQAIDLSLQTILEGLATGAINFLGWVDTEIATPIADALNDTATWEGVGTTLYEAAVKLLNTLFDDDPAGDPAMAGENVTGPLGEAIAASVEREDVAGKLIIAGGKIAWKIYEGMAQASGTIATRFAFLLAADALSRVGGGPGTGAVGGGGGGTPPATPVPGAPAGGNGGGEDSGGGGGSAILDFLTQPWRFFAAGGVAMGGVPTWVGERGPELFIPSHTGSVIPAHRAGGMAGGGGQTINIDQVHLHGVQNPAQMLDSLERMAFRRNQRVQQPA
jgi:TP901 family phage tail tape measure protein